MKETAANTTNSRVYKLRKREPLDRCTFCPPGKGCNNYKKGHSKYSKKSHTWKKK